MEIRKAAQENVQVVTELALALWPGHTLHEFSEEFSELLQNPDAAVFLAYSETKPVGFAQCQLRRDYVEGTCSSPVGYLEGIYVCDACRRRRCGKTALICL